MQVVFKGKESSSDQPAGPSLPSFIGDPGGRGLGEELA